MSLYQGDDNTSGWTASRIVGALLAFLGAGVVLWTVVQIFQLFTLNSAFITLGQIVPQRIAIWESAGSSFVLPREVLIYGIPLWAFSVTTRIGVMLMKSGLQYIDLPRRGGGSV